VVVSLLTLVGMRLRKVNPTAVIRPLISATKAGLNLEIDKLEAHHLAGGNVQRGVNALISADKANIDLNFQHATAIDLAGRDVFEAVKVSVNPKVIETPKVAAMANDGIQIIAQAKAEERRAMAVAAEQEMRAKLVEAEAQVPQAITEAFRQGSISVRDYYDLRNIQADTQMRESWATGDEGRRQESE